jgi:FkbM family methyltransferase
MKRTVKIIKELLLDSAAEGQKMRVLLKFVMAHIRFLFTDSFIFEWKAAKKNSRLFLKAIHHRAGTTECYYYGLFDRMEQSFLMRYLESSDSFADVGANIGSYSLLVANMGVKVVAFEPESTTFAILEDNIARNNFSDIITSVRCAVGEKEEEVRFTKGNDTRNHVDINATGDGFVTVQCKPLDKLVEKVSVIKIDVEGYELQVLSGARRILTDDNTNIVIIESLSNNDEITKVLHEYGFTKCIYDINSNTIITENVSRIDRVSNNFLFIKNVDFAVQRIR